MIGKVCPRGQDVAGLIRYLYGPGRREEHTDPHIIAGYRDPADLEPPLRASGTRDFRRLVGRLRLPHDALGKIEENRTAFAVLRLGISGRMMAVAGANGTFTVRSGGPGCPMTFSPRRFSAATCC